MHRGNPSLTGVVQSSGLPDFHQELWETEGQYAKHLPLVANRDLIYAICTMSIQSEIHAFEQATGKLRWSWKPTQNEFAGHAHLYLDQDILYYPVNALQISPDTNWLLPGEKFLYAFDTLTGQLLRRISIPDFGNRSYYNQFALHQGILYLCGMDSAPAPATLAHYSCAALDLRTEQLLWTVDMGVHRYATSPIATSGRVYIQTYDAYRKGRPQQRLHALDARTGIHVWEYADAGGPVREFALAGSEIFLLGSTGLEVLDASLGTRLRNIPFQRPAPNGSPTVTEDFLCLTFAGLRTLIENDVYQTGELLVLDRASGQLCWSASAKQGQYATEGALVAGETLYIVWEQVGYAREGVLNATLFALDLRTGRERWHLDAPELSPPLLTDGNLFLVQCSGEGRSTRLRALA